MKITLRPYQNRGYDEIRKQALAGHHRILGVGPTSMGKTALACAFIESCVSRGKKAMFVVHRREIIEQTMAAFDFNGIENGVVMADHFKRRPEANVQIASIQTLASMRSCRDCNAETILSCATCKGKGKVRSRSLPEADFIVIDECHRTMSKSYTDLIAEYPNARILGLTATPRRLDGKGLGEIFTSLVVIAEMQELIDQGYLLPIRYFAPARPDVSGVKIKCGEYDSVQLEVAVSKDAKRIGRIVEKWLALAEGRTTLFFGISVADSLMVMQEFLDAGVPAAHVDAGTPKAVRAQLFSKLRNGEIKVLCNVDIATEGVDIPSLGCVILGRPTKSVTVFLQAIGRSMRIYPGQEYAIVLDHAGCVYEHGLPSFPRKWSLKNKKKRDTPQEEMITSCPSCMTIRPKNVRTCPTCGLESESFNNPLPKEADGELVEYKPPAPGDAEQCQECGGPIETSPLRAQPLRRRKKCKSCQAVSYEVDAGRAKMATPEQRLAEWRRLESVRVEKGFQPGWSAHQYRNTFGVWPPREPQTSPGPLDSSW